MKTTATIIAVLMLFTWRAPAQTPSSYSSYSRAKHVEIDKTHQELRAYEGDRLVFHTNVSTGRPGHTTPSGSFHAGGKEPMHYSRLYHNAPMPYSVSLGGNYFIHGYSYVPNYPASHGCVRVPMNGKNPAREFYNWVEPGTPVHIGGRWEGTREAAPIKKKPFFARLFTNTSNR